VQLNYNCNSSVTPNQIMQNNYFRT